MRIGIHGKEAKGQQVKFIEGLMETLLSKNVGLSVSRKFMKYLKSPRVSKFKLEPFDLGDDLKRLDAFISLGGDGTLLDHCIMMWGSGLEDGNKHARENLPFILAGGGGGSPRTGRFLPDTKGNQGDLLTTLLACAGIPLDRPIGIATKEIKEMRSA